MKSKIVTLQVKPTEQYFSVGAALLCCTTMVLRTIQMKATELCISEVEFVFSIFANSTVTNVDKNLHILLPESN